MRVLCLNFEKALPSSDKSDEVEPLDENLCESFLYFSPKVQLCGNAFFIEISSTSRLHGGELALAEKAAAMAQQLVTKLHSSGQECDIGWAIADHTYLAKALTHWSPHEITHPGEDSKSIGKLPLRALEHLVGIENELSPPRATLQVVQFFHSLGFFSIQEILNFPLHSFRERWGKLGTRLWQRIHLECKQVISPFAPQEFLTSYFYSDFPIGDLQILRPILQKHLNVLFLRLKGRGEWAKQLHLQLICEYSDHKHRITIEPITSSSDVDLFFDLLFRKLEKINFENPIREGELELLCATAQVEQLDFFSGRRNRDKSRWQRLLSIAKMAQIKMGFLHARTALIPEESFAINEAEPNAVFSGDLVTRQDEAIRIKEFFGKSVTQYPHPSLLLLEPQRLSPEEVHAMRLSELPLMRFENSWWRKPIHRDYFIAHTKHQSLLWIFWDHKKREYFLHGYFD